MAKLPNISRLVTEDFPKESSWIGKLLNPLNTFMVSIYNALNKQLTFNDNMLAMTTTVTVVSAATFEPVQFKVSFFPVGIWVIKAQDKSDNPQVIHSPCTVDWSYSSTTGLVTINGVSGITTVCRGHTNTNTTIDQVSNINDIMVGQTVTGTGISAGTTVTAKSLSANTITISQAASATATVDLLFSGLSYNLTLAAIGG